MALSRLLNQGLRDGIYRVRPRTAGRGYPYERLFLGHCGHWGSEPPTAAMGRSADVDAKVGLNDRLAFQVMRWPWPLHAYAGRGKTAMPATHTQRVTQMKQDAGNALN